MGDFYTNYTKKDRMEVTDRDFFNSLFIPDHVSLIFFRGAAHVTLQEITSGASHSESALYYKYEMWLSSDWLRDPTCNTYGTKTDP